MTRGTHLWPGLAAVAVLAALAMTAGGCSSPIEPTPPTELPTVSCPSDITAVSNDANPVVVNYPVPTSSGGAAPVSVACTPSPGSSFPPGTTTVTCAAIDRLGRQGVCGFRVKVGVPPRLKLTRFMAFGDSLTEGKLASLGPLYKLADFPGSYPTVLISLLLGRYTGQTPTMSKQGFGGETTAVGLPRLQGLLSAQRPDVLLLMEGANDLSGGDPAAIAPAARNIDQMVTSAKAAGVTVFLATLPPQVAGGFRAGGAGLVQTYNTQIASIAATRAVSLVDMYVAFSGGVATYVGPDGLHLTTAGYQKMAETFFAAIQASLEIPGVTPAGLLASPALGRTIPDPSLALPGPSTSASRPTRRQRGR